MEIDDKLKREAELLQNFIAADEEDKKENENDYFKKTRPLSNETAFDDMKSDNIADISTVILKRAKKSFYTGLMPSGDFGMEG